MTTKRNVRLARALREGPWGPWLPGHHAHGRHSVSLRATRCRRSSAPARDDGLLEDRLELGAHLLLRDAGLQSSHEQKPPHRRARPVCRQDVAGHRERDAQINRLGHFRSMKRVRRDTDNGEGRAIHANRLADDGGIAEKPALPVAMTDNRRGFRTGAVVRRSKRSAERGWHAQAIVVGAAHDLRGSEFGAVIGGDGHRTDPCECKYVGERGRVIAELFERRCRKRGSQLGTVRAGPAVPRVASNHAVLPLQAVERNQVLGILHRECTEEHCVHDAEHRGVGADAQREDGDRRSREADVPDQRPAREAQVAPEIVDQPQPEARPTLVLVLLDRPELDPRPSDRFVPRQSVARHEIRGARFDVKRQLVGHLTLDVAATDHATPEGSKPPHLRPPVPSELHSPHRR